MKIIPESAEALAEAVEVLRSGGTVIHATETCYGLACDLGSEDAVRDLFDVKKRPEDQAVSALFHSVDAARAYVEISPKAEELFSSHFPGPLTLVLPRRKGAPPLWVTASGGGEDPWIGVRITLHPAGAKLAEAFGKPIATTSANIHGKPSPYSVQEINDQWADMPLVPELVIDSGALPDAPPSTVVKVIGDAVTVLRQGRLRID